MSLQLAQAKALKLSVLMLQPLERCSRSMIDQVSRLAEVDKELAVKEPKTEKA